MLRRLYALVITLLGFSFGSFLSMSCLGVPPDETIDLAGNAPVIDRAIGAFDPSLVEYLDDLPLLIEPGTRTAFAHTENYVRFAFDFPYIGVSDDWDKVAIFSRYWDIYRNQGFAANDPVFSERFKFELLVHEYLHMLEAHIEFDIETFFLIVERWYCDKASGLPTPSGNRLKYILWWNLFGQVGDPLKDDLWLTMKKSGQYEDSQTGREEFAYIGSQVMIETSQSGIELRMSELSQELLEIYKGIIHPRFFIMNEN